MKPIILILVTTLCSAFMSQATETLIRNGEIKSKEISAKSWELNGTQLTASGVGNLLSCRNLIAGGDFTIEAKLTLKELNGSAASLMLGSSHFGLDGRGKKLFLEGLDFPKNDLGSNATYLKAGKEFALTITRKSDQLTITIDGKEVTSFKYHNNEISGFGLRPHRNTMSVSELTFDGKFAKVPELDFVFACGDDGHKSYRIPSVIKTKKGTLIASCEARVHNAHDSGDINLAIKRSTDHGKTWSKLTILRDIKQTAGNPCPVVDQETGRIVMVFCEMDHYEAHVIQGKSERRVFTTFSDDDGITWSDPVNITESVNPDGKYNWLAAGPGVGIQIQHGEHKGRMVVPFANTSKKDFGVHTIYSDDKGKTWKASNFINGGCNESQLVELSDGRLMLNMRMQHGRRGYRGISYSKDGGEKWSELTYDDELNDSTCQASIITHEGDNKRYTIFSNPATGGRNGMTIKVSTDDGETWPLKKLIYPRSAGYSCIVVTDDNHLLCLFEGGPNHYAESGIAAIRVPLVELEIK